MQWLIELYDRATVIVSSRVFESGALLLTRLALAGVFWRSGRTKVAEGSWLELSDTTRYLFQEEYSAVPLPAELSMHLATYAEHLFPILLVLGLATRASALSLLMMTMTIQIFVYPDAWWPSHSLWAALSLVLISRGAGSLSTDAFLSRMRGA
ncbi:MAG: DoxX family protein [Congregibacter sp.]